MCRFKTIRRKKRSKETTYLLIPRADLILLRRRGGFTKLPVKRLTFIAFKTRLGTGTYVKCISYNFVERGAELFINESRHDTALLLLSLRSQESAGGSCAFRHVTQYRPPPLPAAVHPSLPDDEIQIPYLQVMQE